MSSFLICPYLLHIIKEPLGYKKCHVIAIVKKIEKKKKVPIDLICDAKPSPPPFCTERKKIEIFFIYIKIDVQSKNVFKICYRKWVI